MKKTLFCLLATLMLAMVTVSCSTEYKTDEPMHPNLENVKAIGGDIEEGGFLMVARVSP